MNTDDRIADNYAIPIPTTRYLCPVPECEWTHDRKGPPDGKTEAVLESHVATHSTMEMLKGLVVQDMQLRRLRAAGWALEDFLDAYLDHDKEMDREELWRLRGDLLAALEPRRD